MHARTHARTYTHTQTHGTHARTNCRQQTTTANNDNDNDNDNDNTLPTARYCPEHIVAGLVQIGLMRTITGALAHRTSNEHVLRLHLLCR